MSLDPITIERIRSIFLHRGPQITPTEAARLLDLSDRTMKEMIEQGEIESVGTCNGPMIAIHELAEQALQLWSMSTIEEALGKDASLVLPAGVRTRTFAVRLPRYVIAAVEHTAQLNDETAEMLLTRVLRDFAVDHKDCLTEKVPGFAEAIEWPAGEDSAQVS
jgi:excisionase family DNA binding protein